MTQELGETRVSSSKVSFRCLGGWRGYTWEAQLQEREEVSHAARL